VSLGIARAWYEDRAWLRLLAPLAALYALLSWVRRGLYRAGMLRVHRFPAPVVIIGNIAVGGTGKTPLTEALIRALRERGLRPGVVSRGYGGHAITYPLHLDRHTSTTDAGDEPVMLHRRTGVPVVVDPVRVRAVRALLATGECDVVLCDDGLQHYALARDIEVAVIDGRRGVGNGWRLPAGPLREPVSRLRRVDHVVVNGEAGDWPGAVPMRLLPEPWVAVDGEGGPAPAPGSRIHAVAGIGHPERFFEALRAQGFDVVGHAFPDHHDYLAADLDFGDDLPVVMTEKDAVKCQTLPLRRAWFVPVRADLPAAFLDQLCGQIAALARTHRHAG
jgi:tetraacyldisaccharide 4'-kinase